MASGLYETCGVDSFDGFDFHVQDIVGSFSRTLREKLLNS